MAEKDTELTGEALDQRAAELDIEGRSSMSADEKRDAIADAERDPQTSTDQPPQEERSSATRSDELAQADAPPEWQAPGPEQPERPTISVVDTRVRIEPRDRSTYVGAVNRRSPDVDVPDSFVDLNLLADEGEEVTGEPVDVFQVLSSNGALALRFDGHTFLLDPEQARALSRDVSGALLNVVT